MALILALLVPGHVVEPAGTHATLCTLPEKTGVIPKILWYNLVMDKKGVPSFAIREPVNLQLLGAFQSEDGEVHSYTGLFLHEFPDLSAHLLQQALDI